MTFPHAPQQRHNEKLHNNRMIFVQSMSNRLPAQGECRDCQPLCVHAEGAHGGDNTIELVELRGECACVLHSINSIDSHYHCHVIFLL